MVVIALRTSAGNRRVIPAYESLDIGHCGDAARYGMRAKAESKPAALSASTKLAGRYDCARGLGAKERRTNEHHGERRVAHG